MFIVHFNDAVFIAKLVNFIIFVAGIVWLYKKYGNPALVAHQEAENKAVEDAKAHRDRSELAVNAARAAIEQAKLDGARMVEIGNAQAARLIEAERTSADAHAQRFLAHASGALERERYRVRRELLDVTVAQAHSKAQELARQVIDPARQQMLVEETINYLERAHA
jgi:F0F1-type ATP synthase membrane subunit b/b'